MSNQPNSWDPYTAPQTADVPVARGPAPTGLKAICIIAIVLGALGLATSCGGVVQLAVGESLQSAFNMPAGPGIDPELARAQQEMQAEIVKIGRQNLPLKIVAAVLHILSALGLLVGGIMTLRLSRTGRSILLAGCGAAILYELLQTVLGVMDQLTMMPIVQKFFDQGMPPGAGEMPPAFGQFMAAGVVVGIAFTVIFALVKLAFYLFSVIYLQRKHVVAHFTS